MGEDDDPSDADHPDGDSEEDTRQAPELSIDATLEILAQRERRYILSYLTDSSEEVATTDELVEHILQRESERTGEVPNRDHLESSLYHIYLPRLTDTGILEYDPWSQQLRYWGGERLEEWLERVDAKNSNREQWSLGQTPNGV